MLRSVCVMVCFLMPMLHADERVYLLSPDSLYNVKIENGASPQDHNTVILYNSQTKIARSLDCFVPFRKEGKRMQLFVLDWDPNNQYFLVQGVFENMRHFWFVNIKGEIIKHIGIDSLPKEILRAASRSGGFCNDYKSIYYSDITMELALYEGHDLCSCEECGYDVYIYDIIGKKNEMVGNDMIFAMYFAKTDRICMLPKKRCEVSPKQCVMYNIATKELKSEASYHGFIGHVSPSYSESFFVDEINKLYDSSGIIHPVAEEVVRHNSDSMASWLRKTDILSFYFPNKNGQQGTCLYDPASNIYREVKGAIMESDCVGTDPCYVLYVDYSGKLCEGKITDFEILIFNDSDKQ